MNFLLQCIFCREAKAIHPLLLLAVIAGVWLSASWIVLAVRKKGVFFINRTGKILIVIALIATVVAVVAIKQNKADPDITAGDGIVDAQQDSAEYKPENIPVNNMPMLIDIGADTCIPCKLMAPILEELKKDFVGRLAVRFIDLNSFPEAAKIYSIKLMPTQIFYDAFGKELFRHEGFYSKEDILNKWTALGVDLSGRRTESPADAVAK